MITKELLIKARDTLPQRLAQDTYYDEQSDTYCGIGWLAHCAGLIVASSRSQSEDFMEFESGIPSCFELIRANDECTWEHERYNRVKHVLDSWIERLSE